MSILNALNTFTAFNKRILIFILGAMLFLGSVNLSYGNDIPEDYPYAEFYSHSQGQDRGWFGAMATGATISGGKTLVNNITNEWNNIKNGRWNIKAIFNGVGDSMINGAIGNISNLFSNWW